MRRWGSSVFGIVLVGASIAATCAAASPAKPAADDVMVGICLGFAGGCTAGVEAQSRRFVIGMTVDTTSGAIQDVEATIMLPPGLTWGADGPDPTEGCTGTAPAVCRAKLQPNEVGTVGAGWGWDVLAERNGSYEIRASVTTTEPDPDLSNNTTLFRLTVAEPSGEDDSGTPAVSAGAARLTPAKPKAGSAVTATVRVTAGGAAVRPSRVSCTGTLGAAKLKGTARAARGSAACTYRTPKTAKGKTLRGAVAFTAQGKRFSKRFSARLG